MNWFYTDNNEQRGPVSESEFDFLVRAGKIKPDTLVWREGMAGWQPWSEIAPPPAADAVPPPVGGALQISGALLDSAGRNGPSWEQRETLGFLHAAVETVKEVLQNPSDTFSRMKREGGLSSPLLYALIVGGVGSYVGRVYEIATLHFSSASYFDFYRDLANRAGVDGAKLVANMHLTGAKVIYALVFALFKIPLQIALGSLIFSAVFHVCLMLMGGAKQSFETTFRVLCYSLGSAAILQVIPICGGLIGLIWCVVSICIGFAMAHEIATGKAVVAVLLPLICCCAVTTMLSFFTIRSLAAMAAQH